MGGYYGKVFKGDRRLDEHELQGLKNFFYELEAKERAEKARGIDKYPWWAGEKRKCNICREVGHLSWNCPVQNYKCKSCGLRGHLNYLCKYATHKE